jgi:hypothetical protein
MPHPATGRNASASSSRHHWNPKEVLRLCNDDRCVGYAHSQGRKCRNPIRYDNVKRFDSLLAELSAQQPDPELLRAKLQRLAAIGLCLRNHQDQIDRVVEKWARSIRVAFPTPITPIEERRPAVPTHFAAPAPLMSVPQRRAGSVGIPGESPALNAILATLEEQLRRLECDETRSSEQYPRDRWASFRSTPTSIRSMSSDSFTATRSYMPSYRIPSLPTTVRQPSPQVPPRLEPRRISRMGYRSYLPLPSSGDASLSAPTVTRASPSPPRTPTSNPSSPSLPGVGVSNVPPDLGPRHSPQRRCASNHVRRLPLDGICPICHDEGLLSECDASELVWCRSTCGRTIHKACMSNWVAQCAADGRGLTCSVCRGRWDDACDCEGCFHVRRQPVTGECAVCLEELDGATSMDSFAWCKDGCGKSVHGECFDTWRAHCVASERDLMCVSCQTPWSC